MAGEKRATGEWPTSAANPDRRPSEAVHDRSDEGGLQARRQADSHPGRAVRADRVAQGAGWRRLAGSALCLEQIEVPHRSLGGEFLCRRRGAMESVVMARRGRGGAPQLQLRSPRDRHDRGKRFVLPSRRRCERARATRTGLALGCVYNSASGTDHCPIGYLAASPVRP